MPHPASGIHQSRIISRQGIPGANWGEVFTASIADRPVIPQVGENYWDSLLLSYRGTIAAANTVIMELFLQLVQPFVFNANEPRISLFGRDMFALCTAFYEDNPAFIEGATATVDDVEGIRIPLWITPKSGENYSYFITRVAQTNISAEVFSLSLLSKSKPPGGGRIDARTIQFTTPAATGAVTQVLPKLPKLGSLLGLLIFATTVPTQAAVTCSAQNIFLDTPSTRLVSIAWDDARSIHPFGVDETRATATALVKDSVLRNYVYLDFFDDPIDLIANDVAVSVDSEVASDIQRYVPVIQLPA